MNHALTLTRKVCSHYSTGKSFAAVVLLTTIDTDEMDEPVTDVKFVSFKESCPDGYKLIESCLCGHEAQLWEKVLGGKTEERFLCYTKEEKEDEMVIEDMYIPGRSAQYLYKGYKIVKETLEGDEPMYHKQLAIKKVPRTHASKVIADIIICRSRDHVSKMYKKLDKVNGLCICFRQVDIGGRNTPPPKPTRRATLAPSSSSSSAPSSRQQRSGSLKIGEVSQHLAGVTLNDQGPPSFRRGSGVPLRRSVSPLASHSHTPSSPQPSSSSPPHGEVATLIPTLPLTSSPPPPETDDSGNLPSAPPPTTTSHYPPPVSTHHPPSNTANYPPPANSTQYPPQHYPPPPSSTTTYPPSGGSYQQATYPPPPSSTTTYPPSGGSYQQATYPPPSTGYGPPTGGGLGFSGMGGPLSGGYSSYPPPPPGGYGGYGAVAGPSFAAAHTVPRGPAPYNPYQSQQGHSPYPPPGGQPPPAASGPSYGFNF